MSTEMCPPKNVVWSAICTANVGPCAKSQRGVIIYNITSNIVVGSAWNSPPLPFDCTATDACKRVCRKIAVHAEERALIQAKLGPAGGRDYDLVHVKTVDRHLVPGGPPSCLQCSRLVVEVGVHVWLYEGTPQHSRTCVHCKYVHIWGPHEDTNDDIDRCPNCGIDMEPISRTEYIHPAEWCRYAPVEFHRLTLKNNEISVR